MKTKEWKRIETLMPWRLAVRCYWKHTSYKKVNAKNQLEGDNNATGGEETHWEEAVAEDGDYLSRRHTVRRHQCEQHVDAYASQQTQSVDVVEVHLSSLQNIAVNIYKSTVKYSISQRSIGE